MGLLQLIANATSDSYQHFIPPRPSRGGILKTTFFLHFSQLIRDISLTLWIEWNGSSPQERDCLVNLNAKSAFLDMSGAIVGKNTADFQDRHMQRGRSVAGCS